MVSVPMTVCMIVDQIKNGRLEGLVVIIDVK